MQGFTCTPGALQPQPASAAATQTQHQQPRPATAVWQQALCVYSHEPCTLLALLRPQLLTGAMADFGHSPPWAGNWTPRPGQEYGIPGQFPAKLLRPGGDVHAEVRFASMADVENPNHPARQRPEYLYLQQAAFAVVQDWYRLAGTGRELAACVAAYCHLLHYFLVVFVVQGSELHRQLISDARRCLPVQGEPLNNLNCCPVHGKGMHGASDCRHLGKFKVALAEPWPGQDGPAKAAIEQVLHELLCMGTGFASLHRAREAAAAQGAVRSPHTPAGRAAAHSAPSRGRAHGPAAAAAAAAAPAAGADRLEAMFECLRADLMRAHQELGRKETLLQQLTLERDELLAAKLRLEQSPRRRRGRSPSASGQRSGSQSQGGSHGRSRSRSDGSQRYNSQ